MGETEVLERGNWSGRLDFLLSCIGYAVGLGNVWRFPYLAYRNGGATFLIPYVIMLAAAGLPLFLIELAIGQFSSEGPITLWKVSPLFTGIGFGMCFVNTMVAIYYNVIIMYAIYYMFVSFVSLDTLLPWQHCNSTFNTEVCRVKPYPDLKSMNATDKLFALKSEVMNETCIIDKFSSNLSEKYDISGLTSGMLNITMMEDEMVQGCKIAYQTPSEQYWTRSVLMLQESDGMDNIGAVSLRNCLCLALAWLLIFGCLIKGIKSTGKVVYFTATFPYVILIILLIRGVTLEGYWKGIEFYIIPKVEKLANLSVWGEAATQIFYSLGIGFGGLITMSSYNRFNNNVYRDAIIVALINCATSIFAGFAIFSILGYMAHVTNQEVENVATEGVGLAFVAYPEGIARLPVAPVWSFLFFFMLLTLGMDSQFAMMETVISSITDIFPAFLRKRKASFTFFCCTIGFLLGIPMTTRGGIYILTLMNAYTGSYNLIFMALMEIICLMYVYGYKKFCEDIGMMVGYKPNIYWLSTWLVLTPITLIFIFIASSISSGPVSYDGYVFPDWAQGVGWVMAMLPIVAFVIVFVIQIIRYGGIKQAARSRSDWGPALPENRTIPRYQNVTNSTESTDGWHIGKHDNAAYINDVENDTFNEKHVPSSHENEDTIIVQHM